MQRLINTPQFKSGDDVARFLDNFFGGLYQIDPTSPHCERVLYLGDRIFTNKETGKKFFIEYKSGIQTFYTGNIFLETISVDTQSKPGWVYTCKADYIFYAALLNHKILIFRPGKLRAEIVDLKTKFKEVKTNKGQNNGYNTYGIIVPLDYAERHLTEQIIEFGREAA